MTGRDRTITTLSRRLALADNPTYAACRVQVLRFLYERQRFTTVAA